MTARTRNSLIIAIVVALIAGAGFAYMLFIIVDNGNRLNTQIDALTEQNEQAASLFRLQRIAQESTDDRAQLEGYFLLRESDSITFLTEIETLAPRVGVLLETESLEQVTADDSEWIEFTFALNGERQSIENFVQILEIIPYVSRVQSFEMSELDAGSWEGRATIQVQLLSYDS